MEQAFTSANDEAVYWCVYAPLEALLQACLNLNLSMDK